MGRGLEQCRGRHSVHLNTSTTEAAKSTTHSLMLTLPSAGYLQKNFSPVVTGDTYNNVTRFLGRKALTAASVRVRELLQALMEA